jgi:hypothetical protein
MAGDAANRATDPDSQVEGRFDLVPAGDGSVSAVTVELTNTSAADDVVLKVNSTLSAFITLTVTDAQGGVLSNSGRKFSSAERQTFELVRLRPGQARRWRVPLGDQVDARALPDGRMQGRLVINVVLLYRTVKPDAHAGDGDDDFNTSILTLSDMDVTFTRAALGEGASPSRNGH